MTKPQRSLVEVVKDSASVWTAVTTLIAAASTLRGFVANVGGPLAFLGEVGAYGVACYAALWLFLPLAALALRGLERASGRVTTQRATGLILGAAVLGGGWFIRTWFYPGFPHDLDAIGTAFMTMLGAGTLLVPLLALWYAKGSQPRDKAQSPA